MRRLAALALIPLIAAGQAPAPAKPKTPSEIAAAAPKADWREVPADDLVVFELQGGKRVVMQLAPDFAPVHVANIRALAKGGWVDAQQATVQPHCFGSFWNHSLRLLMICKVLTRA